MEGRILIDLGFDNDVREIDAATSEPIARLAHQGRILSAMFSPDGRRVLTWFS